MPLSIYETSLLVLTCFQCMETRCNDFVQYNVRFCDFNTNGLFSQISGLISPAVMLKHSIQRSGSSVSASADWTKNVYDFKFFLRCDLLTGKDFGRASLLPRRSSSRTLLCSDSLCTTTVDSWSDSAWFLWSACRRVTATCASVRPAAYPSTQRWSSSRYHWGATCRTRFWVSSNHTLNVVFKLFFGLLVCFCCKSCEKSVPFVLSGEAWTAWNVVWKSVAWIESQRAFRLASRLGLFINSHPRLVSCQFVKKTSIPRFTEN